MNARGGINWYIILMAPALIILLISVYPVIDEMTTQLFSTLDSSSNIFYTNIIKLLIGSIGIILMLGIIWTVVGSLRTRDQFDFPREQF